ncbi:MAG: DUF5802 family protein [Haloarculaceae archaeon]
MFERFSSGYYLGRLYVEPREGDRAAIARAQHEQVNEQLYADEGVSRTDRPLVMKLGTTHFAVTGEPSVPADTLAVPERLLDETTVRNPPTLSEVFLAKADRARQLLSVAEGLPSVESDATGLDGELPGGPGPTGDGGGGDGAEGGPFGGHGPGGPTGI